MSLKSCSIFVHGTGSQYLTGSIYCIAIIIDDDIDDFLKKLNFENLCYEQSLFWAKELFYKFEKEKSKTRYLAENCVELKYVHIMYRENERKKVIHDFKNQIIQDFGENLEFIYYDDFQLNSLIKETKVLDCSTEKACKLIGIYLRDKELNTKPSNFNFSIHLGEDNDCHKNELNIFKPERNIHRFNNNIVNASDQKSVYLEKEGDKLLLSGIPINKSFSSRYSGESKKIFFKKNEGFHLPLDKKYLSFLSPNGSGKTSLCINIENYFLRADKDINQKIYHPEFWDRDNYKISSTYVNSHINYCSDISNNEHNLYLFSLNKIFNYKFDYLILPHLDYVLKKFNIIRIFDDYIKKSQINIEYFSDFFKQNKILLMEREMHLEPHFRILFKENSIFEEIKKNDLISLVVYLTYQIALENNLNLDDTVEKIIHAKDLNWNCLDRFLNNNIFTENGNLNHLKSVFFIILSEKNVEEQSLGSIIICAVNEFKNSFFYNLFREDFLNYEKFTFESIKENEFLLKNDKIVIKKHYSSIFDTTLLFPEQVFFLNKKIKIDNFVDDYDMFDKCGTRSLFSLIEKNGSDFEKIEYKVLLLEVFFKFLISSINLNTNNKVIILSDDLLTQTDNHNILFNLLKINELIEDNNQILITWVNFTHSFSFFQIFNRTLNIDYKNLYLMKSKDNRVNIQPLPIKGKFFVDYLNSQIKSTKISDKEKFVSLYTKIIYKRFVCENMDDSDSKNEETYLTKLLHFFPDNIKFDIKEKNNSITCTIENLINSINKKKRLLFYDDLFDTMCEVFNSNFDEYKSLTDIEISFFLSIYLRFLIEKYVTQYLNIFNIKVSTDRDYTGNLLKSLNMQNPDLYNNIRSLYNLSKNYIHHDYINYEYLIFVDTVLYKKQIMIIQDRLKEIISNK